MPRVRINQASVHYQQSGQGPDLVLIHGLFCNLAFWYLTVMPKLAKRFRVTVYDLRGHGYSERTGRGYRSMDLAQDLAALLDHLHIERVHVVGHSFGGAVALAFAARHPARVTTLTLADAWVPSLQPLNRTFWNSRRQRLSAAGVDIRGQKIPRVAYSFFEELIVHRKNPTVDPDVDPNLLSTFQVDPKNSLTLKKWWQLVKNTSAVQEMSDTTGIAERDIRGIACPTIVLFGSRSNYLPTLRKLRRILHNCNTVIVANAGHFFPILKPNILVDTITRFAGSAEQSALKDETRQKSA